MGAASLPSGTLSALFTAVAFGVGAITSVAIKRFREEKRRDYKKYVSPLKSVAIDTEGRAFPHPQTISLLRTARGGLKDSVFESAFKTSIYFAGPALLGFGFPAYDGTINILNNIFTAKPVSIDSALPFGLFSTAIFLPLARSTINSKLLARKYVFCAPPSAQAQTEESGALNGIGQHSYAPIPIPVRR